MNAFTVLHAEDDPDDVFMLGRAVRRANLKGMVALQHVPDGQQAINYLSGSGRYADRVHFPEPDLILLDLKMPAVSGFEVLAWARSQPRYQSLPIFVLSSSDIPEDIAKARQLGADHYYIKSVDFADVVQSISSLVAPRAVAS